MLCFDSIFNPIFFVGCLKRAINTVPNRLLDHSNDFLLSLSPLPSSSLWNISGSCSSTSARTPFSIHHSASNYRTHLGAQQQVSHPTSVTYVNIECLVASQHIMDCIGCFVRLNACRHDLVLTCPTPPYRCICPQKETCRRNTQTARDGRWYSRLGTTTTDHERR